MTGHGGYGCLAFAVMLWGVCVCEGRAQTLTIADFFSAAQIQEKQYPAAGAQAQSAFESSGSNPVSSGPSTPETPRMPWIERYELRTLSRDFDPTSQRYTFRLLPNSPGKRRRQRDLARLIQSAPQTDLPALLCDRIEARYYDWAKLYEFEREAAIVQRLLTVLEDRLTVFQRRSATGDVEWGDYLAVRTQRTDLLTRQAKILAERRQLLDANGVRADSLSFAAFPGPLELGPLYGSATVAAPLVSEINYEIALVEAELALEQAEQRQYLDFVQFRYQGPEDDPFRERFSVGVGLQIPNGGNARVKRIELEMERDALLRERDLDQRQAEMTRTEGERELETVLELYREQAMLYADELAELNHLADRLAADGRTDPGLLLRIRERELRNELRLLDVGMDATEAYLDALRRTGKLCGRANGGFLTVGE